MTFNQACQKAMQKARKTGKKYFVFLDDPEMDEYIICDEYDADTFCFGQEPVRGFWPSGDCMDY